MELAITSGPRVFLRRVGDTIFEGELLIPADQAGRELTYYVRARATGETVVWPPGGLASVVVKPPEAAIGDDSGR